MRKAIGLVLLIVLGTMPLNASAQASVPAVDLHCLNIHGDVYSNDTADVNSSAESNPSLLAIVYPSEGNVNITCTVTNPNPYTEKIELELELENSMLYVDDFPASITLASGGQESFNFSVFSEGWSPLGKTTLGITAKVVETNGVPPPNVAESYVEGVAWVVTEEFMRSSNLKITEIGPFKSAIDSYTMENGTEYPVLYLRESFHLDAIMTGWDGKPIADKCLNIYVDQDENPLPIVTINTSENGTIEWFSGDPSQNPSLKGVETTGGKLEGFRTIRLAYEPDGNESQYTCNVDDSGNLTSSYFDIEVLVRSRINLQVKQTWRATGNDSVNHGEIVEGEVVLLRDRLDLSIANEIIGFQFYYTTDGMNWTFDHEEFYLTNELGIAGFQWPAKFVDHDECSTPSCHVNWRITAYYLGSRYFSPGNDNITLDVTVVEPFFDSDGDGVEDDDDAFPDDPDETHDDDGDGVGNNTDEFPQDPDEQFDKDGDGVGDNADDFPDNKYASNWSTIYAAVGTLIVLLIGAGVMVSRMKKEDELPNVPASNDLEQLEKQIQELERMKAGMIQQQDPTELMFKD